MTDMEVQAGVLLAGLARTVSAVALSREEDRRRRGGQALVEGAG